MKEKQTAQILRYLKTHKGGITPRQALDYFSCQRLASRICDLKREGYVFKRTMIAVRNKDGEISHVANYKLVE